MMGSSGEPWGYYPQDSNGLAVQNPPAEPCACPGFAPTNVAVCSPLVDGGCNSSEPDQCTPFNPSYLSAVSVIICTPPAALTPCNPQQRQVCSRFCRGKGGVMTGCVSRPDGFIGCICTLECNEQQWQACERDCQGQGRGSAIGCAIHKGYVVPPGQEIGGRRVCECEKPEEPKKPKP